MINRIPRTTYRLQLRAGFGFDEVFRLVDYLEALGVSDIYLSPLFQSRKDSSHGYDVVDHATIEPDFGDLEGFRAMAHEIRSRGMGIVLDLVPNHMGINDPSNLWWNDVLENGEVSRYARCFDIDWDRLAESLRHKVLLPILGDHFGRELEQGKLQVCYREGRFQVEYYNASYPLSPITWTSVLGHALDHLNQIEPEKDEESPYANDCAELEGIITQLSELPPRTIHSDATSQRRYREQTDASLRLKQLHEASARVRTAIQKAIESINGTAGESASFNELEAILDNQCYRLAFWRVASDEINYRRFFDINDLAAIRVEDAEVFSAVHVLAEQFLQDDLITGLRIDHPDGLLDPQKYFEDLQRLYQQCKFSEQSNPQLYVAVEKILAGDEPLPSGWCVNGSTGYDFLNDLTLLQVNGEGLEILRSEYSFLTSIHFNAKDIIYLSKKQVLAEVMSSELHTLAGRLHRLTQRHRMSRDFTFPALLRALGEVIACFPVYRTYVSSYGWEVDDADFAHIMAAVRWAKLRNPTMDWTTLDFIASVLLLQFSTGVDETDREQFRDFVLRFQQITGPIAAKGIEDTAFYRYYPLAAINEVGGELNAAALTAEEFHRRMQHRTSDWPHSMSATATHDTKRGEDVRARLSVLSEVPDSWTDTVRKWRELNRPLLRTLNEASVPSPNEEYLLYQTLVGTWPLEFLDSSGQSQYAQRITEYMQKALREAKVSTSWTNPSVDHEAAVEGFIRDILDPERSADFHQEMQAFVESISDAGFINSLSQVVLKATLPGVPDFYQGTELWDFRLVDPDNRAPVDYSRRQEWLEEIMLRYSRDPAQAQQDVWQLWPDARVKLFVTWRLLQARAEMTEPFEKGDYFPLTVSGAQSEHLFAFARRFNDQWVAVATALQVQRIIQEPGRHGKHGGPPVLDWRDTVIELPDDAPRYWQDAFSQKAIELGADDVKPRLVRAEQALSPLPVALFLSSPR